MDNTQTYLIVVFVIILVLLFIDKKSSKEHFVVNTCDVFNTSNNLLETDYYTDKSKCLSENGNNFCSTLDCSKTTGAKYYFKNGDAVTCDASYTDLDKNYFTGEDGKNKVPKCYYN